jgi:hypothetical protein
MIRKSPGAGGDAGWVARQPEPHADRKLAMTLPYRQERLLRRTDRALSASDPHLAAMLSIFTRITLAERLPAREQLRSRLTWAWSVLLWPVSAAAFLVVFVAGGGARAATACSAAARSRVQLFFWVTSRRLTVIRTLSKG